MRFFLDFIRLNISSIKNGKIYALSNCSRRLVDSKYFFWFAFRLINKLFHLDKIERKNFNKMRISPHVGPPHIYGLLSIWFWADVVSFETTRVKARFSARKRSFSCLYLCSCFTLIFVFCQFLHFFVCGFYNFWICKKKKKRKKKNF